MSFPSAATAALKPLTVTQVAAQVRRIAAANPDYTYIRPDRGDGCLYQPTKVNPQGCIIGAALLALGVAPSVLKMLDSQTTFDAGVDTLFGEALDRRHTPTLRFLTSVQWAQDRGATWGTAVKTAERI